MSKNTKITRKIADCVMGRIFKEEKTKKVKVVSARPKILESPQPVSENFLKSSHANGEKIAPSAKKATHHTNTEEKSPCIYTFIQPIQS